MKTPSVVRAILFVSAVTSILCSAPCQAQIPGSTVRVIVPFGFELGDKHFEPGNYTIARPSDHLLSVRNGSSSGLNITRWESSNHPTETAKVVFHRYGSRYFLREVWPSYTNEHLECSESKQERQARRSDLAANTPSSVNVQLAVLDTSRMRP